MNTGTRLIELTQGQFAIVDAVDYDFLMQWDWYALKFCRSGNRLSYYAGRHYSTSECPTRKIIWMHCIIAERAGFHFKEIDHLSRNGLDNRRNNLRPCTRGQNNANKAKRPGCSSSYKGVYWNKAAKKWHARMTVNRKSIHLGFFLKEIDAHHAYKAAAIHHFGEFACFA